MNENLIEEVILKFACETFMKKECIAALLCEHLDEYDGLYFEDVRDIYIDNVFRNSKDGCIDDYDFCVVAHSPNIEEKHRITVGVKIKMSPQDGSGILPNELIDAFHLFHEEKMRIEDETILHCYGFCFYLDPPEKLQNNTVRMNSNIRSIDTGENLLKKDRCDAIVVYLGDNPTDNTSIQLH